MAASLLLMLTVVTANHSESCKPTSLMSTNKMIRRLERRHARTNGTNCSVERELWNVQYKCLVWKGATGAAERMWRSVRERQKKAGRSGGWEVGRLGGWESGSPTPLSSMVGLSIQRCACSIFPSKCTAAFAGLLFATALLVLDCRFCRAVAICLAKALASGVSPLPL